MAKTNGKQILVLIVIFGILLYNNNAQRAVNGIESWFSNPLLITAGNFYYVMFFGLVSGYVIAKILRSKK